MQLEIQVALNFIISYLYNKLPRRRVNIFGEELERQLKQKYEGHWYPDKPFKGSGFRCIHVGEKVDPVVEKAAKESGLDIEDVRHNLPQDLSVWIDPFEVSYQIGEKGPVKVLYVDDSNADAGAAVVCGGLDLDKEIKNSFNPEAQVFMPISEPLGGGSPASSSPSPPFGHSAAVSPTFMPRSAQPLTFTTATFAATKFGSTKMKSSGRNANGGGAGGGVGGNNNNNIGNNNNNNIINNGGGPVVSKVSRSSPTHMSLNVNGLLKQKAISTSVHSLYGLGLGLGGQPSSHKPSALSPNAKEFVFPSLQGGPGSPSGALFPGDGPLGLGQLQYSNSFDVFAAYGGLHDKSLMDSLSFSLGNMQYSNQQFQPVMAN
ncbi:hypothetical protein NHX12_032217 [Muraenolepis orangiensis]|uniref:Anti-proliferative protein domain-containing protein n=1 Tax=Muraenolepis orangiensis TaxID=630683 RepID=A0A9Q0E727_9TELE|nr:hypothetical protein NHX12_032217 [Muraenolepis orangiensis]